MKSPRFAQMRCIYSGQRQPIMRRASRLHSWDVFAYEPLPNRLRPSDLALGRLSKETNRRRSGATSRICRRREDSADVRRWVAEFIGASAKKRNILGKIRYQNFPRLEE